MNRLRRTLRVKEIFYSLQGESTFAGYPCIFIRTAGCHLRCRYCDTTYAFSGGTYLELGEILHRIRAYPTRLVELTGGEPLLQSAAPTLLELLLDHGYQVLLETSGDLSIRHVPARVIKIVDIKCPDSGAFPGFHYPNLKWLMPWDQLKFVISTDRDLAWALALTRSLDLHERWTVLFSPAHGVYPPRRLAAAVLESGLPVRVQIQLHKYLELNEPTGTSTDESEARPHLHEPGVG